MNDKLHHIRLLAGLEIHPGTISRRVLTRRETDELASHLAADLARVQPDVHSSMLVVGGALLEPAELIRPGYPAWQGLEELSENSLRRDGFEPQIMAIGAFSGRMPHEKLQPPGNPPGGQFIALPLLLVCDEQTAGVIESALERDLFESGSIDPPARAVLEQSVGMESVHGQLLTVNDLLALQRVQLDSAGLGGFWPAVEHILLQPEVDFRPDLPGGLKADWTPGAQRFEIRFESFDQATGKIDDYALWLRAFRMLTALLETHGIDWHPVSREPVAPDQEGKVLVENAGRCDQADSLTVHHHPDLGLVCWSLVEQGRLKHLYPLDPGTAVAVEQDLAARTPARVYHCRTPNHDSATGRLQPAPDQ